MLDLEKMLSKVKIFIKYKRSKIKSLSFGFCAKFVTVKLSLPGAPKIFTVWWRNYTPMTKLPALTVTILFLFTFFNLILDAPRKALFRTKKLRNHGQAIFPHRSLWDSTIKKARILWYQHSAWRCAWLIIILLTGIRKQGPECLGRSEAVEGVQT